MTDHRQNDEVMLEKLDQLKTSQEKMAEKLDKHIEKTDWVLNGGNDTPGLKTQLEVMKTRLYIVYTAITAAFIAIINDYVRRG